MCGDQMLIFMYICGMVGFCITLVYVFVFLSMVWYMVSVLPHGTCVRVSRLHLMTVLSTTLLRC